MPTAYKNRVCGYCSSALEQPSAGRPRRWCSPACRQAGYAQRKRRRPARNEWWTPEHLRERVLAGHEVVLDAAACAASRLVEEYLGPDHPNPGRRDALAFDDWHELAQTSHLARSVSGENGGGAVVWLNAPFLPSKTLGEFLSRAVSTASAGTTVVGLVPSATGTRWWWDHVSEAGAEVEFLRGRLAFGGPHAGTGQATVAPWACALITWSAARLALVSAARADASTVT